MTEEERLARFGEVVHTRDKTLGGRTQSVTVVRRGVGPPLLVSPVNLRSRGKMFRALIAAAANRNVPVREVWESAD